MKLLSSRPLPVGLAAAAVLLVGWQVRAETNRVTFPENLDQLVHYTTVKRGNVTEHILTTRDAMEAVKNGQPIPNGDAFRAGRPSRRQDLPLLRDAERRRAGVRIMTIAAAPGTGSSSGSGPTRPST